MRPSALPGTRSLSLAMSSSGMDEFVLRQVVFERLPLCERWHRDTRATRKITTQKPTSASPRCLDGGDVDLLHRHHRLEGTLCLTATCRKRIG